uniref:Protein phosphatase Slingshot homolog 1 n=1 Tax=Denticeps clupeoides TaxID=299321 RepID=A0AAY4B9V2_9TELE
KSSHDLYSTCTFREVTHDSFFMVKGAALFLQQGSSAQGQRTPTHHKHAGDLPQHLQIMINTLRSEDRIKLAVRLESAWTDRVRYMVVVYTNGRQDTEENILLGMDFTNKDSKSCSIGMVLPLWSDTKIHLDGDGGFSVSTAGRSHVFKPVSVQAMWSALQVLHKACEVSRRYNYFPGGMALTWTGYYESCISSEQSCINEWNAMTDLETTRPDSPAMFVDRPTERERTECLIKAKLRSVMVFQDLENVTSKEIRNELEQHMSCNLKEFKEFIDNEMLLILGQMDKATLIFDHLYLGSEWNASNLEELQESGVGYILNVTREIDNFFPGTFAYHNVRVYDDEATDLLAHWNDTYNFIVRAKKNNSRCLVHCKMGVSRSASTVIAYAMKEHGWSLEKAYNFVKQKRSIACPNASFMRQLAEYEGILDASKQRHNKLWRPEADNDEELQASAPCSGLEAEPEPSTPVRGPPLLGMERVFIEIEDVERDALLDDEGFPTAHLGLPGEGTAAQTCGGRLEPLEDMRLRLEFSTVEEEDEEEAQKEEAEMAALASGAGLTVDVPRSSSSSSLTNMNRFNNENANNSNRLAAKRSCPPAFDVSRLLSPMSCEELPKTMSCALETEDLDELQEEEEEKDIGQRDSGGGGPVTELTLLKLSLDGSERPVAELHQEARSQPLVTGLVRQRTERLEQLSSLSLAVPPSAGVMSEVMDLGEGTAPAQSGEDMEVDGSLPARSPIQVPGGASQSTPTPAQSLTRSSSSDSLHSVHGGQPGLVRQRAQEIEARVRLAGLTMPSRLKRSSSLAKLAGLTLSTEDLSLSNTCSSDGTPRSRVSMLVESLSGAPKS